ncbi:hypothetical protein BEL04_13620 [Mucilaginibacter sp. PPCGB 2223]|uniref:hypothetical protein n=1 Tax=Mucilaginibacter sp. PPCGB 2223 TaxID=1886027 RepID=UPI00082573D8|nr:hypothetical protein [Mucilaginibacter sp. PPCGB 2223]OCX52496.1 hypothetical protein BEL04_13620 [Mucilaginibacter sp. PPCGB 2223]
MEINNYYTKYKSCISTACGLFKRYEKYQNCFGISTIDRQMNSTFYKIVVSYSKMTQSIINIVMPPRERAADTANAGQQTSPVDGKGLFLEYTLAFIEKNEGKLLESFLENQDQVNAQLSDLEDNVNNAGLLVNRMEGILKSGQHLYCPTGFDLIG